MSTTTQILFNSPALHSLKRDQLVKLCKIHSLKASGKNKELIERLQLHAKTLPPDDPLSIATRDDDQCMKTTADSETEASNYSGEESASESNTVSRPSEHWEVVMDTIAEVDEETLRSNRGASDRQVGEFGTNTSKVSVTTSLRAIATSLGLKRNASKTISTTSSSSSLSSKEVGQSTSVRPPFDSNGGSDNPPVEPIPGQSHLRGLPAPSAARLSLSEAPATTTIRLVSNPITDTGLLLSPPKLQPFATSFDLVPDTPGGAGSSSVPVWPVSSGGATRESLYPPIPDFQGFGDLHNRLSSRVAQYENSDMDIDVDMPGGLAVPSICEPTSDKVTTSARLNTGATPKSTEKPVVGPVDIFSPAPKPQRASTRSKLGIPRSEPFVFGSPLPQHNMSNLQFRTAAQSVLDEMNKRLADSGVEAVDADVLNNRRTTTEESVVKQEGNDSLHVGDVFDKIHQKQFDKMDSIASHYAARRGAQGTAFQPILTKKRKSSLVVREKRSGVPAARHRPNGSRVASGSSVKMFPGDFGEEGDEDDELADGRLSKRPRVEPEEPGASAQPDNRPSASIPDPEEEAQKQREREAVRRRLDHNKAKRRSSVGRPSLGRAPPPKAKPARFGFFASAKSLVQNVWNRGAGSRAPAHMPNSKSIQLKEETKTLTKSSEAKKMAVIPGASGAPSLSSQTRDASSGGSRTSVRSNVPGRSTHATPVSRSSTIAGYGRCNDRVDYLGSASSLGRKSGFSAHSDRVGLMETKSLAANLQRQMAGVYRSRTSSTLMAPTASSLAKTSSHSRIPVSTASHNENLSLAKASMSPKQPPATSVQLSATLGQITNSPRGPVKVFSQPSSPSPAMSLATAPTSITGEVTEARPPSSKLPVPLKTEVAPGRRPRISRSKVIAKLASQRAVDAGSSATVGTGGKVRSSMGAQVAGKTSRYGGDHVMMSAKRRVRQSEHARRQSRTMTSPRRARQMDVD